MREEQRRVEPGKEKRNGKTKLNIPKGIGGVDRRTGGRERFESGGGRKAMKSVGSTFINGASRQCRHARRTVPRVYKYISHATWFIMPAACSKSLWFTVSKLAWIRPIRWSNERRNPYPLSNRGRSLKATLSSPFSNCKVNRRLVEEPSNRNRFHPREMDLFIDELFYPLNFRL